MELLSRRRFSWGAAFWASAAAALLVASEIGGNPHMAILALAPAMLAFGLVVGRRRAFRCLLTEEGLEVDRPPLKLSYAQIEGLTVNGLGIDPDSPRLKAGTLMVMHPRGAVEIPAALNVPVQKVYRAILAMLPPTGCSRLSPTLAEHFEKETAMFGPERVHAFGRRKVLGRRPSTRRGQICAMLLLACGIAWCLVYGAVAGQKNAPEFEPWIGFGIFLSLFSILGWAILHARQSPLEGNARRLKNAELIVSPTGIAVSQGDIQGHLRWAELLDVKFSDRPYRGLVVNRESIGGGIQLIIAGAKIGVADVYDRPIALIHKLMMRYWKGEQQPVPTPS
jgi:hypothetical protein